ncbi:MAG: GNAT family N-acetyltransferase [Gaiellaceae bacterium]
MSVQPSTGSGAAERLHEALRASFKAFFPRFEGARIEERRGYLFLVCPALPLPQLNGIWAEGQELEHEAVSELEGAVAEIETLGLPCWVQMRSGRTPALEAEARRLGLSSEESLPGMVASADDLRVPASPGLEITRVADAAGLGEVQAVAEAGFEVSSGLFATFYTPAVAAARGLSIYVARVDGEPVSTAISLLLREALGIFNVGTPPEHRRRGYGAAVTARAVREGVEAGASFAWLQSSQPGESVYRRIGFRQVETYTLLSRPGNGAEAI